MDWFQHRSKCMDGTLFKIFHKYNSDGYYIYFRVVEILADGDHLIKPKKNIKEWWEKEIMKSWVLIEPVLDLMASEGMIELEKDEEISVLCPNLGVLNPEWLRKLQYRESQKTATDGTGTEQGRNSSVLKENKVKEKKVKESKENKYTNSADAFESCKNVWNASSYTKVSDRNDDFKKKVYKRVNTEGFDLKLIIDKADKSKLIQDKGTWFTFDWIFKNDTNWRKVIDGNYDNTGMVKKEENFADKYKLENNPAYKKYLEEKGIKE